MIKKTSITNENIGKIAKKLSLQISLNPYLAGVESKLPTLDEIVDLTYYKYRGMMFYSYDKVSEREIKDDDSNARGLFYCFFCDTITEYNIDNNKYKSMRDIDCCNDHFGNIKILVGHKDKKVETPYRYAHVFYHLGDLNKVVYEITSSLNDKGLEFDVDIVMAAKINIKDVVSKDTFGDNYFSDNILNDLFEYEEIYSSKDHENVSEYDYHLYSIKNLYESLLDMASHKAKMDLSKSLSYEVFLESFNKEHIFLEQETIYSRLKTYYPFSSDTRLYFYLYLVALLSVNPKSLRLIPFNDFNKNSISGGKNIGNALSYSIKNVYANSFSEFFIREDLYNKLKKDDKLYLIDFFNIISYFTSYDYALKKYEIIKEYEYLYLGLISYDRLSYLSTEDFSSSKNMLNRLKFKYILFYFWQIEGELDFIKLLNILYDFFVYGDIPVAYYDQYLDMYIKYYRFIIGLKHKAKDGMVSILGSKNFKINLYPDIMRDYNTIQMLDKRLVRDKLIYTVSKDNLSNEDKTTILKKFDNLLRGKYSIKESDKFRYVLIDENIEVFDLDSKLNIIISNADFNLYKYIKVIDKESDKLLGVMVFSLESIDGVIKLIDYDDSLNVGFNQEIFDKDNYIFTSLVKDLSQDIENKIELDFFK